MEKRGLEGTVVRMNGVEGRQGSQMKEIISRNPYKRAM